MDAERPTSRPPLRLLRGGRDRPLRRGRLRIVAASRETPPFPVDAVAIEEDTFLVLSAPVVLREPDHPIRVMTAVLEARGEAPGSVVVRDEQPLRFLAVVHDLSADPSWREEWVEAALVAIFREADRRRLRALALPLLGTVHGRLDAFRFMALLESALARAPTGSLERLWLVIRPQDGEHLLSLLERSAPAILETRSQTGSRSGGRE